MSTKTYPVTILQECYQSKVFFNKTLQSLNKENATFPKQVTKKNNFHNSL